MSLPVLRDNPTSAEVGRIRPCAELGGPEWIVSLLVAIGLVTSWARQYPGEVQDFLGSPLADAPYWLVASAASFVLLVYLERVLRKNPTAAFADSRESIAVGAILGLVTHLLDARVASGPFLGILYLGAALVRRSARVPMTEWTRRLARIESIRTVFFLSGASALLYQVIWQWRLMAFLGANAESVAIIVTVFMAGLGLGGYLGGVLAERQPGKALLFFFLIEVAIGSYGLLSLPLLDYFAGRPIPQGWAQVALVAGLLIPPTTLMGATLPILVRLMRPRVPEMNENVGKLYAVNAYGSGIAAIVAVIALFPFLGQKSVTVLAASFNYLAAALVLAAFSGSRFHTETPVAAPVRPLSADFQGWPFHVLAAIALLTGAVTLGQEVLLLRQAFWLTAGRAETFGIGVGAFLVGLAAGSWRQTTIKRQQLAAEAAANWTALAGVIAVGPFVAAFAASAGKTPALLMVLGLLFAAGFLGARSLPMVAGLLKEGEERRFGTIYFANIVGSVAGSFVLGHWLADVLSLATLLNVTALLTLTVGGAFWLAARRSGESVTDKRLRRRLAGAFVLVLLAPIASDRWLERMLMEEADPNSFLFVAESKSGIVAVNAEGVRKVVYGGGVYDGAISYGISPDLNGIGRLVRALSLHPNPSEVLEIGLSSGSWARAILMDDRVRSLISVEINPAYKRLVAHFSEVSPILHDTRFRLIADDGRRWLRVVEDARFDMIVSNTTYHWRSGATLITSTEFMRLVKSRLKPRGLFLINTTYSENVTATTCEAFKHCVRIGNTIAASDSPLDLSLAAARRNLGRHAQFAGMDDGAFGSWYQQWPGSPVTSRPPRSRLITDDEMTDEFRRR